MEPREEAAGDRGEPGAGLQAEVARLACAGVAGARKRWGGAPNKRRSEVTPAAAGTTRKDERGAERGEAAAGDMARTSAPSSAHISAPRSVAPRSLPHQRHVNEQGGQLSAVVGNSAPWITAPRR